MGNTYECSLLSEWSWSGPYSILWLEPKKYNLQRSQIGLGGLLNREELMKKEMLTLFTFLSSQ